MEINLKKVNFHVKNVTLHLKNVTIHLKKVNDGLPHITRHPFDVEDDPQRVARDAL